MKYYGVYHRNSNWLVRMDTGFAVFDTQKDAVWYSRWVNNHYGTWTYVKEMNEKPNEE